MASLDAKNKEDIGYRFSIVMGRGMGGSREGEGRSTNAQNILMTDWRFDYKGKLIENCQK